MTDNDVSFAGIDVFTVEDGRIESTRTSFDPFGPLTDVGAASIPSE